MYDTASVGVMHALAVAREEAAPSVRKRGLVGAGAPVFRIYAPSKRTARPRKQRLRSGLAKKMCDAFRLMVNFAWMRARCAR